MEFSRQEYWSGLPFPSPGELPDPGIKPRSPALQADALPSELPEYIKQNARLDEAQAGIKIAERNINNLRYAGEHHPYGRKQRGIEQPLAEGVRRE